LAPFETKRELIDERLLHERNTIAYGEYLLIDRQSLDQLSAEVVGMLDAFRAPIDDAVALGSYRMIPVPVD
jgi:hypothetical protein